ncbi:hypothetical protein TNIN_385941 [Trichonephila inaurata madagascariensis]|uniref:Uncharacterized protein n=1 Tax=Trichonephila inaurata madagascariensis TaxID=2747483 RepID=A0A8X6YG34_9ARAC|nr:hypothetical protein TNIN_385941 [Trichonephila inaurata madagascariensis]
MDVETSTVLRGTAKAALTRTINFIEKDDQTFNKNDTCNKLEKLELIYTEFDKANAALPIESSEMEEFEEKYYETKTKLQKVCIAEFQHLRPYYRKEKKKLSTFRSGTGAEAFVSKWEHFTQLNQPRIKPVE